MAQPFESSPVHHTHQVKERLQSLMDHLREEVANIDEPQAKALFETTAEVLGGLHQAFEDYERKNEAAWEDE